MSGSEGLSWRTVLERVAALELPADHVVIGGVMVYLHGVTHSRVPDRVTYDVDVLFDLEIAPRSLVDAVACCTRV